MTKSIEDYTAYELSAKIKAIKAERERTANALKRYEEELEHRKQKVQLGVPLNGTLNEMPLEVVSRGFLEWFSSEASADKFADYFYNFVEALQKLAKGEPIDIQALLPLLKKGWVAMDKDEDWYFFTNKPSINFKAMDWRSKDIEFWKIRLFNLKPATDWTNSLMECGL